MKGIYTLFLKLEKKQKIKIGALGKIKFPSNHYVYVGSALNNLEKRVERHLRKEKKYHWHIDYLRDKVKVEKVKYALTSKNKECLLAKKLYRKLSFIECFGSSDCCCDSHLFYSSCFKDINKKVEKAYKKSKLRPQNYKV